MDDLFFSAVSAYSAIPILITDATFDLKIIAVKVIVVAIIVFIIIFAGCRKQT